MLNFFDISDITVQPSDKPLLIHPRLALFSNCTVLASLLSCKLKKRSTHSRAVQEARRTISLDVIFLFFSSYCSLSSKPWPYLGIY